MNSHVVYINESATSRGIAKVHVDQLGKDPALKTVVVAGVIRTRTPPGAPELLSDKLALEAPVDFDVPANKMQVAGVIIVDFLVTAIQHVERPCTVKLKGALTLNGKTYKADDSIVLKGQGFGAGALVWRVEEP